jgi:uncharacterized protein (DUF4415 family)
MKKKSIELSAFELLTKRRGNSTFRKVKDSEIDYSDLPALSDKDLKKFRRVGRPLLSLSPRQAISIRLEVDVLQKLKKRAKKQKIGYQSLINEILKKAV